MHALQIVMVCVSLLFFGAAISAQTPSVDITKDTLGNLQNAGASAGVGTAGVDADTPGQVIGRVIEQILIVIGVVFFILVTVGGIMWMTSGGNEEQVGKGQKLLSSAVIGLGITVAAYLITRFVMTILIRSAEPTFIGL